MRKFLQRGYSIQAASMAAVVARLISKINLHTDLNLGNEKVVTSILIGILREVDPLVVIDGIGLLDEHEAIDLEKA